MSIIIRLQNLPWSANSSDIRHFFGGLNIPEGGVHIIGGETGDAFIAFQSDEDARVAMQKNGCRLKDCRVNLILSSRAEMQHLIEQVRSGNTDNTYEASGRSVERLKLSEHNSRRRRSSESGRSRRSSIKRSRRSRSPTPPVHRSAVRYSRYDSHPKTDRRSSPRKQNDTRDERRLNTKYKDPSSFPEQFRDYDRPNFQENQHPEVRFVNSDELYDRRSPNIPEPVVPPAHNVPPPYPIDDANTYYRASSLESQSRKSKGTYRRDDFEQPPGKSFKDSLDFEDDAYRRPVALPPTAQNIHEDAWNAEPLGGGKHPRNVSGENWFQCPNEWLPHEGQVPSFSETRPMNSNFKTMTIPMASAYSTSQRQIPKAVDDFHPNYCVQLSGFPPNSNFKDVQAALKRLYAPQRNIKWAVSRRGYKTGIAYVKLSNKDDFVNILSQGELSLDGTPIHVSECPNEKFYSLFVSDEQNYGQEHMHSRNGPKEFCYMLKGLPYATSEDDVINFFTGLNLKDLVILYDKNGKATGTGYAQFSSIGDYNAAFERNGKKIGHRYIELFESSREDIDDAKSSAAALSRPLNDILNERMFRIRCMSFKQNSLQKRPLCVVLSGLPVNVSTSDIFSFFSECGVRPDGVHNILNESNNFPSGRAFAEILDLFDLDVALKQHGKFIGEYMVSVKQVLFEEMMKILDTHPVMHDFGIALKKSEVVGCGPVPEKLPYIWEPPDSKDDPRVTNAQKFLRKKGGVASAVFNHPNNLNFCKDSQNFPVPGRGGAMHDRSGTSADGRSNVFAPRRQPFEDPWPDNEYPPQGSAVQGESFPNYDVRPGQKPNFSAPHNDPRFYEGRDGGEERFRGRAQLGKTSNVQDDFIQTSKRLGNRLAPHQSSYENRAQIDAQVPFVNQDQGRFPSHPETFIPRDDSRQEEHDHSVRDSYITRRNWDNYGNTCEAIEPFSSYDQEDQHAPYIKKEATYPQHEKPDHYENAGNFFRSPDFESRQHISDRSGQFAPRGSNQSDSNYPPNNTYFEEREAPNQFWNAAKESSNARNTFDRQPYHSAVKSSKIKGRGHSDAVIKDEPPVAGDKIRAPIKFGVKPRQSVSTSEKLKETFDPALSKENGKRKLRKLSPEKQQMKGVEDVNKKTSASKPPPKTEKPQEKPDVKPKDKVASPVSTNSSQKQNSQSHMKKDTTMQIPKTTKAESEMATSSEKPKSGEKREVSGGEKEKDSLNKKKERDTSTSTRTNDSDLRRQRSPVRGMKRSHKGDRRTNPRNPNNMPPSYPGPQFRGYGNEASNVCVIQVSNVPPYCGLTDILNFFRGFCMSTKDIIRRYTDGGVPTGDVRVTFENSHEARRAVRSLNHQELGGVPVTLFFI